MRQTGFPSHPFLLILYTICSATLYGCSVKRNLRSGLFKLPLRLLSLGFILVGETIACKRAAGSFKKAKCAKITSTAIGNNTEAKGNTDWVWAHMATIRLCLANLWLQDPFGHCMSLMDDKLKKDYCGREMVVIPGTSDFISIRFTAALSRLASGIFSSSRWHSRGYECCQKYATSLKFGYYRDFFTIFQIIYVLLIPFPPNSL